MTPCSVPSRNGRPGGPRKMLLHNSWDLERRAALRASFCARAAPTLGACMKVAKPISIQDLGCVFTTYAASPCSARSPASAALMRVGWTSKEMEGFFPSFELAFRYDDNGPRLTLDMERAS